jgi:hypothetical protein
MHGCKFYVYMMISLVYMTADTAFYVWCIRHYVIHSDQFRILNFAFVAGSYKPAAIQISNFIHVICMNF